MNTGTGSELTRDRLPLRGIAAVVDTLLYLGFRFVCAFGMGRGPERGAAAEVRRNELMGHERVG